MKIVIIGNGISGITAAKTLRKHSDHQIIVISDESELFFSRTALMYVFMGHMRTQDIIPHNRKFYEDNNIELYLTRVRTIDFDHKSIILEDDNFIDYDKLIIATGSKPRLINWPGKHLDGVHSLYHIQDLENIDRHSETMKHAIIVGGGLIGVELAEMLHSRKIPVTMLVRESEYWRSVLPLEEAQMISEHVRAHGVNLKLNTELKEIWGDKEKVKMILTSTGEKINCEFVGLTVGVVPNIDFLDFTALETGRGILVDDKLKTNMNDVYAVGDCAELRTPKEGRKNIEAVWYTGRMMGELAAHNILGKDIDYNPGIWFNSAKFFDIEYQVYGNVPNNPVDGIGQLFWQHPKKSKSIRIVYDQNNKSVLGFNLLGIRYRHEVCEKWILEKTPIEEVLSNLNLANFDPEFFSTYEQHLVAAYNKETGSSLKLRQKKSLSNVLNFLSK
jgi:NAD(P)H-nitrite reductase large subunit